jgi:hypothetical protein
MIRRVYGYPLSGAQPTKNAVPECDLRGVLLFGHSRRRGKPDGLPVPTASV